METLTTDGIKINVETQFLKGESDPDKGRYCHAYRVTIINESNNTVQLMSRHWVILDSDGEQREVKGEGVVGQQPVLHSGESHQYVSWCPLKTDMGHMHGTYAMVDKKTNATFYVQVPKFKLIYPPKLN